MKPWIHSSPSFSILCMFVALADGPVPLVRCQLGRGIASEVGPPAAATSAASVRALSGCRKYPAPDGDRGLLISGDREVGADELRRGRPCFSIIPSGSTLCPDWFLGRNYMLFDWLSTRKFGSRRRNKYAKVTSGLVSGMDMEKANLRVMMVLGNEEVSLSYELF
ncbi:phosphatidylinositol-4-phosphate 5-kinase [Musa troglodytarum]|uniref:Phosphatidylinositol-4-phosphate 5-kinase n=1 Tax=Musa troglodytarum TaxID=320322 RepID=A0A9E7KX94_9LILI|nr:phosphatidylinositol-4-phosphate 5-kinase [Musa troglodytarum]